MTDKRIWAHVLTGGNSDPLTIAHLMEATNDPEDDPDVDIRSPLCGQTFGGLPGGEYEWTYLVATPLAIKCKKCLRIQVRALLTNSERPAEHRGQRHLNHWEDCDDCSTIVYNTTGRRIASMGPPPELNTNG